MLVHGVGVGPESFAATQAALRAAGRRVHGVVRPGYGLGEHAMDLDAQVDRVLDGLGRTMTQSTASVGSGDRPAAAWVGVSGGATLGVIAAIRRPAAISVAVLHEPLIGSAAPELHAVIRARCGSARGRYEMMPTDVVRRAVEYMTGLVGPEGWEMLGPDGRAAVEARAALIVCEVPRFARFEPSPIPPDGAVRVVITVGERSPARAPRRGASGPPICCMARST